MLLYNKEIMKKEGIVICYIHCHDPTLNVHIFVNKRVTMKPQIQTLGHRDTL